MVEPVIVVGGIIVAGMYLVYRLSPERGELEEIQMASWFPTDDGSAAKWSATEHSDADYYQLVVNGGVVGRSETPEFIMKRGQGADLPKTDFTASIVARNEDGEIVGVQTVNVDVGQRDRRVMKGPP